MAKSSGGKGGGGRQGGKGSGGLPSKKHGKRSGDNRTNYPPRDERKN